MSCNQTMEANEEDEGTMVIEDSRLSATSNAMTEDTSNDRSPDRSIKEEHDLLNDKTKFYVPTIDVLESKQDKQNGLPIVGDLDQENRNKIDNLIATSSEKGINVDMLGIRDLTGISYVTLTVSPHSSPSHEIKYEDPEKIASYVLASQECSLVAGMNNVSRSSSLAGESELTTAEQSSPESDIHVNTSVEKSAAVDGGNTSKEVEESSSDQETLRNGSNDVTPVVQDDELVLKTEDYCSQQSEDGEKEDFRPTQVIEMTSVEEENDNERKEFADDVKGISQGNIKVLRKKGSKQDTKYQCGYCTKEYATLSSLKNHIDSHDDEGPKHKCSTCGKVYLWERNLNEHLEIHKEGAPKHICGECGKQCASSRSLNKHSLTHVRKKMKMDKNVSEMVIINNGKDSILVEKRNEVRIHRCALCKKDFSTVTSLNTHLRTHRGEKPFRCDTCGKDFTQKGSLALHQRVHTGERPFECSFCKKTFSQSGSLRTHLRTHSGARPFECEHCGKGFTQRGSLQAHLRTHTGNRPYPCPHCDKRFTQTGSLTAHLRVHTGERPYSCEICNKAFSQQVTLKKHFEKCRKCLTNC